MPSTKKQAKSGERKTEIEQAACSNTSQHDNNDNKKKNRLRELALNPDKINPRRLAKAIPGLEERLNDTDRPRLTFSKVLKAMEHEIQTNLDQEDTRNYVAWFFYAAAKVAVPGSFPEAMALQTKMEREMFFQLCATNRSVWRTDMRVNKGLAACSKVVIYKNRDGIRMTCFTKEDGIADETEFERHYQNIMGMSLEEFVGKLHSAHGKSHPSAFVSQRERIALNVFLAVGHVELGCHESEHICWQCGKKSKFDCTQCQIAKYCSKECQLEHWKIAHKPMCFYLKDFYGRVKEGMAVVDKAHKNPEEHKRLYGWKPSAGDYHMASSVMYNTYFYNISFANLDQEMFVTRLEKGPSMKNFYTNLRHVVLDGLWMTAVPKVALMSSLRKEEYETDPNCDAYLPIAEALMYNLNGDEDKPQTHLLCQKLWELCDIAHYECPKSPARDYDHVSSLPREVWLWCYYENWKDPSPEEIISMHKKSCMVHLYRELRNPEVAGFLAGECKMQRRIERSMRSLGHLPSTLPSPS